MKINLESIAKTTWTEREDYLVASWPNGKGEYRIIGNTFGSYKYDANGKPELVDLKLV